MRFAHMARSAIRAQHERDNPAQLIIYYLLEGVTL
jgi:hypothetical protein